MIQRALGIIIGLNHNIPIEKWCLLSGEHTKPQKMKRIHGKREFPTMDVESRRVKPINEMKFPGLRVWVDTFWSIEFWSMNHSWMRLATCIVASWCMQSSQEEGNWRKKAARNKRKNLQIFGLERSNLERISAFRQSSMQDNAGEFLWFRVSLTSSSMFFTAPLSNVSNLFFAVTEGGFPTKSDDTKRTW